ncbi:IS200/IS605 family transposase [Methanoplanus limicola]|uniref:Transposase IS200-family protein n=1 Tax=Methanoplanus limicola DSM 2279 TaxID=937775 RepID=H1Z2Y6_9EURY|nr:IS200/IS605 family transposase [Methanoplanus limicola]EHQ34725.1 transposase IS200-family protein [Methanoplanus limicola DSM 2279]
MAKKERWTHANTCVYNIGYHIIWCPKYRRNVLQPDVAVRLKELLHEKASDIDVIIEVMEIMPDHLHLFVKTKPTASPHWVIQQFKGYTSRILRQEFSTLRTRLPTLWTRSYYCESCGHISDEIVKKYIEDQKRTNYDSDL